MVKNFFTPTNIPKKTWAARLRSNFFTGLIVITPIFLTIWLIWTLTGWIDSIVLPLFPAAWRPDIILQEIVIPWGQNLIGMDPTPTNTTSTPISVHGVGVIMFFIITLFTGWIAKGIIGRSILSYGETVFNNIPVVRSIYSGVKQIAETVFNETDQSFDKSCLVEYPRKGVWAIGFITKEAQGEIKTLAKERQMQAVFIPTTPNPTSGFLIYFPKEDIIELDMSVENAAKLIISAGLVYPSDTPPVVKK